MDSNPKANKSKNVFIDRISELPDPILEKILSFLPAKNVVGTSILSTRWKNLFPFGFPPIRLDLDDSVLLHPERNDESCTSFVGFVDKLLNETLRVDKLILKCKTRLGDAKFMSWICAGIRLNVREIQFDCPLYMTPTLFYGLNGCTTLTRLELRGNVLFYISEHVRVPTLKTVDLFDIHFDDSSNMKDLYSVIGMLVNSCPALEELSLIDCNMQDVLSIYFKSPMLKSLIIRNSMDSYSLEYLCLETPNLELLLLDDCVTGGYFVPELKLLRSAHIDLSVSKQTIDEWANFDDVGEKPWYEVVLNDLVIGCKNTRSLYLSASSIEGLHYAAQDLPLFQNLTWLSLGSVSSKGWMILACLLCNAHILEHLTFQEKFEAGEIGFADFERLVSTPPICLELHLNRIEFWDFQAKADELKLLAYFMRNGKVLEKVELNSIDLPIKRNT